MVILLAFAVSLWGADEKVDAYLRERQEIFRRAEADWRAAKCPGEGSKAGDALVEAAIMVDRMDVVEQVLTEGKTRERMLPIPHGSRRVPLRIVHQFEGVHAQLVDEMFASRRWGEQPESWLARRITKDAVEVWTPRHGWLFDGRGRLRHEAAPPRRSGYGREWYGAFLPDGQWVTTDLDEWDGTLSFFSASGKWQRALTCEQLAPPPSEGGVKLLGWGRSDRRGEGWVVNVGSEEGWATVWVGPTGPARILKPGERWALCYPRALGPRGTWLDVSVPDDSGQFQLERQVAGHGPGGDCPSYSNEAADRGIGVPYGNYVFGFWPGKTSFFIGSENDTSEERSGARTRKATDYANLESTSIVDKTWLFRSSGKLMSWVRARRIGDAADGQSMLFRVTADGRILTIGPDLRIKARRRFVWSNGATADAIVLWDDLHLGIFIHHHRLILAKW